MHEPSAYDLANLIEEFAFEDEQVGVSETSEPWESDHAGAVQATEESEGTRQILFADRQNAGSGAGPALPPSEAKPAWPRATGFWRDNSGEYDRHTRARRRAAWADKVCSD